MIPMSGMTHTSFPFTNDGVFYRVVSPWYYTLHAPNPKQQTPGAGRRVNGGAVRLWGLTTLTRRPATHNWIWIGARHCQRDCAM